MAAAYPSSHPTLLKDGDGRVVGAINILIDIADRKTGHVESARLARHRAGSDDAIISKTLDGRITSWNRGASRILGYSADEMVGAVDPRRSFRRNLSMRKASFSRGSRKGERIDHFDTVRLAKDGRRRQSLAHRFSLRDNRGRSSAPRRSRATSPTASKPRSLQTLLFEELNHRVKNTLATIQAIASQSLAARCQSAGFRRPASTAGSRRSLGRTIFSCTAR